MAEWNEQLKSWYTGQKAFTTISKLADSTQIPRSTLGDYMAGRMDNLDSLDRKRRAILYKVTQLPIFRFEGIDTYLQSSEMLDSAAPSEKTKEERDQTDIFKSLAKTERELKAIKQTLSVQYASDFKQYDARQKAETVGNLLEQLAMSLEPFRTGTEQDRVILIDYIKQYGPTFAYITQMIKTLEDGSQTEWYLKQMQPPHVIQRMTGEKNG